MRLVTQDTDQQQLSPQQSSNNLTFRFPRMKKLTIKPFIITEGSHPIKGYNLPETKLKISNPLHLKHIPIH